MSQIPVILWNISRLIKQTDYQTTTLMDNSSEVLSRLKFLSCIEKGEKISVRTMTLQPDGWSTRISRTLINHDNRNNTLKFIREIISRSLEILGILLLSEKEADMYQAKLIIKDLIRSQDGIDNLKTTYIDDKKFTCDIDVILQQIKSRLNDIKSSHQGLVEEKSPIMSG